MALSNEENGKKHKNLKKIVPDNFVCYTLHVYEYELFSNK